MPYQIPNIVPAVIALAFVATAIATGQSHLIGIHVVAAIALTVAAFIATRAGGVAKLVGATFLWMGPTAAGFNFVCTAGILLGAWVVLARVFGPVERVAAAPFIAIAFAVHIADAPLLQLAGASEQASLRLTLDG